MCARYMIFMHLYAHTRVEHSKMLEIIHSHIEVGK